MNLRFGLFCLVYFLLGILVNLVFLLFLPLAAIFDPQRRTYLRVLYIHHYLVSSIFWKTRVTGFPLDKCRQPSVFVMNHQTILDSLVMYIMDPHIAKLLMASGFKLIPVIGTITMFVRMVFVNRKSENSRREALDKSVKCLQTGISLILAPEGGLSHTSELRPFKLGAFTAACEAGVPVVPVRTESRLLLETGSRMRLKRGTMRLHIFEPISTSSLSPEAVRDEAFRQINSCTLEQ